mmetsp:Transcript_11982/g.33844  ORF Transcript_11982/g.33844 Transcript_11982/m.33844 type:complete len:230 (+) Transcript_11982:345-1034(+)
MGRAEHVLQLLDIRVPRLLHEAVQVHLVHCEGHDVNHHLLAGGARGSGHEASVQLHQVPADGVELALGVEAGYPPLKLPPQLPDHSRHALALADGRELLRLRVHQGESSIWEVPLQQPEERRPPAHADGLVPGHGVLDRRDGSFGYLRHDHLTGKVGSVGGDDQHHQEADAHDEQLARGALRREAAAAGELADRQKEGLAQAACSGLLRDVIPAALYAHVDGSGEEESN